MHAVCANQRRVYGSSQNENADSYNENVEPQPQQLRSGQVHGQAAEQIVNVLEASFVVVDDHGGEHGDDAGGDDGVNANDVGGDVQILQFGRSDFAVDLRQRFKAAHGKQRVAERDDNHDDWNRAPRRCP